MIQLTDHLQQTKDIQELAKALLEFHKLLADTSLKKDSKNPHLDKSYLSLDNILQTVRPLLNECGLIISQDLAGDYLVTTLMHVSGQMRVSSMPFNAMDANRGTNKLQAIGGGITYARRYAISSLLSINVDVDDDGNGFKGNPQPKKPAKKKVTKDQYANLCEWMIQENSKQRQKQILDNYVLTSDQVKEIKSLA